MKRSGSTYAFVNIAAWNFANKCCKRYSRKSTGATCWKSSFQERLYSMAHIFGEAVFSVYSANAETCKGVSTRDYLWKS